MPKKEKKPAAEDTSMQLSDDGEDDSAPVSEPKNESEATGKSRKDRQAELRRMMEEDSEDEVEPEKEDTPMEEPEEEAPLPEPEQKEEEPEPAEVISSTGDGRRRGKRRVMKKKTVMDDQGYLGKLLHPFFEPRACELTIKSSYRTRAGLGVILGG